MFFWVRRCSGLQSRSTEGGSGDIFYGQKARGLFAQLKPLLDHEIIEFAATIPANIKFKDGKLKRLLIETFRRRLPEVVVQRKDKMGFPTPFNIGASKEETLKAFGYEEFVGELRLAKRENEKEDTQAAFGELLSARLGSSTFCEYLKKCCVQEWYPQLRQFLSLHQIRRTEQRDSVL